MCIAVTIINSVCIMINWRYRNMMEKNIEKQNVVEIEEKKEVINIVEERRTIIEEADDPAMADHIVSLLESWCDVPICGNNYVYIRKAGNHLEVGKAEINCIV